MNFKQRLADAERKTAARVKLPVPAAGPWNYNPAEAPKDGTPIIAELKNGEIGVGRFRDGAFFCRAIGKAGWSQGGVGSGFFLVSDIVRFAILNLEGK